MVNKDNSNKSEHYNPIHQLEIKIYAKHLYAQALLQPYATRLLKILLSYTSAANHVASPIAKPHKSVSACISTPSLFTIHTLSLWKVVQHFRASANWNTPALSARRKITRALISRIAPREREAERKHIARAALALASYATKYNLWNAHWKGRKCVYVCVPPVCIASIARWEREREREREWTLGME